MASLTISTFLIVCLCALVLVSAAPNKKDTQVKKASVQSTPSPKFAKCNRECPTEVNAICARDADGKKYSFGNTCVMERYNCAHDSQLVKESDGECPGSKSIRLS